MNKRGQALVEFVLIVPVLIMILFCMIDFGKILYVRINLESKIDNVISLYEEDKTYEEIKEKFNKDDSSIKITITNKDNKYVEFALAKEVEIITPGLNLVLDNPFDVKITRMVYYE